MVFDKEKIVVRKAEKSDKNEVDALIESVIYDNFNKENLVEELADDLQAEISEQKSNFSNFLLQSGVNKLYLVAEFDGKVVGIIAFGNPSHYITDHVKLNVSIQEIKSVLVAKTFQKCGVGSILFTSIINELKREGYVEFCLDCGYKFSQSFWEKKLGEPTKVLLDFWAKGSHHKIWVKNIQ